MILNFLNPSTFTQKTADIKLAYLQSADSWAKVDGFEKTILISAFFYDFEKLTS